MNSKKGVSDIVVTILLVLLSLAAVAIVWTFIRGSITDTQSTIQQSQACMKLDLQPVACDITSSSSERTIFKYRLGSTEANLTKVKLLVENRDGGVVPLDAPQVPKVLQTISVEMSVNRSNVKKFSVAGIIVVDDKEINCAESEKVTCR